MSNTIRIHHPHNLGLDKARKLASEWMQNGVEQYRLTCDYTQGECGDEVRISRVGLEGVLGVYPDHYTLDLKLGFLLRTFSRQIESTVKDNLARDIARMASAD